MKTTAAKVAVVAAAAFLIAAGATRLYLYTSSPAMAVRLYSSTSDGNSSF